MSGSRIYKNIFSRADMPYGLLCYWQGGKRIVLQNINKSARTGKHNLSEGICVQAEIKRCFYQQALFLRRACSFVVIIYWAIAVLTGIFLPSVVAPVCLNRSHIM